MAADFVENGMTSNDLVDLLPGDLVARFYQLISRSPACLVPVVDVTCQRYAVEDDIDRLTLDVDVQTDRGKRLTQSVLEWKSTAERRAGVRLRPNDLHLRQIKLSKFLWSMKF